MQFKDRVVVITGASSGIGRALACGLAGRGAEIALMARRVPLLEELAQEISAAGHRADIATVIGSPRSSGSPLVSRGAVKPLAFSR